MRINQDYLKSLLIAFEEAQTPTVDWNQLESAGLISDEHEFVFHMRILNDQGFVQRADGEPGFGLVDGIGQDEYVWSLVPLRLTAAGHEFIEALRNEEVWEQIKTNFKDASVGTLWGVSKDLLEGYLKRKVESVLNI